MVHDKKCHIREQDRSSSRRKPGSSVFKLDHSLHLSILILGLCVWACEPPRVRYDVPGPVSDPEPPRIAPLPEGVPGLKFLVFGDWGGGAWWHVGSEARQRRMANGMASVVARPDRGVDFAITTGDNFYPSGVRSVTSRKWRTVFEEVYDPRRFPFTFYAVLGNHDYEGNPLAQVAYHRLKNATATGRWYMPDQYYTFADTLADSTVVAFFALDSQMLIGDDAYEDYREKTRGPPDESARQMTWLEERLAQSRARWKVVFMHHPVYSNGWHGDTAWLIERLKPVLEKYRVDVVFSGHDHSLEAIEPVNGVHYFVSGAGANPRSVTWRGNTRFAHAGLGFIWCRVTRGECLVAVCAAAGEALWATVIRK